jgi:hypothetical protein
MQFNDNPTVAADHIMGDNRWGDHTDSDFFKFWEGRPAVPNPLAAK